MRYENATRYDDVHVDVLKLLEEDGLKLRAQLISNMYETGEWPNDSNEVTMIASKKKPQASKCSNHGTTSSSAYTAKVVARILRRRIESKIEDVFGADHFGIRRGKKEKGMHWNAKNNIRTNFRHGSAIVCLLHRLAEGI
jgi:hypothetical protein